MTYQHFKNTSKVFLLKITILRNAQSDLNGNLTNL
jgi:hypothetical protein